MSVLFMDGKLMLKDTHTWYDKRTSKMCCVSSSEQIGSVECFIEGDRVGSYPISATCTLDFALLKGEDIIYAMLLKLKPKQAIPECLTPLTNVQAKKLMRLLSLKTIRKMPDGKWLPGGKPETLLKAIRQYNKDVASVEEIVG